MPLMLSVYNATLEDRDIQIQSKSYTFKSRSVGKIPEDLEFAMEEYKKFGLIVVRYGDVAKEKEKEALTNYLHFLNERIAYMYMHLDEKKRNGVTIDEPARLKMWQKWKQEIISMYSLDPSIENIPSFAQADDVTSLFSGPMEVEEVKELPKKQRGRPARSFAEVNIEEEIQT